MLYWAGGIIFNESFSLGLVEERLFFDTYEFGM